MEDSPEVLENLRALLAAYNARDRLEIWKRLLPAWAGTENTGEHFSSREWLEMFSLAEPRYKPLPQASITVYRGTIANHERGLAWTSCLDLARWFAGRWIHKIEPGTALGYVYKTEAPAAAVVCVADIEQHPHREEHEIIVNPHLLEQIDTIDEVSQEEW